MSAVPDWSNAGLIHLGSQSSIERRAYGRVYTPGELVEFVLDEALRDRPDLLERAVLDPACGAGAFLLAVLRRIAARLTDSGTDLSTTTGHSALLEAASERLFGIDVDPGAVTLARRLIAEELIRLSPGVIPADFLLANLRVADFLATASLDGWPHPGFVVGNPPYVPTGRLDRATVADLRARFATARGRFDLYTVFMQRASDVVALGGVWAFITPDKYLASRSAVQLREHLATHGSLRRLSRFRQHDVFTDAATVPCVTVWERAKVRQETVLSTCSLDKDSHSVSVRSSEPLPRNAIAGSTWLLSRRSVDSLSQRIRSDHPPLSEMTTRVSAGIATGYNPAFILGSDEGKGIEPELLHLTAGGRDVQANGVIDRGQRMLVPYLWSADGRAELVDLRDFPGARSWLARHRAALKSRHCVTSWSKAWWDLHDPIGLPLHRTPKVLVPDLAKTNRFAADTRGVIPQHSVYFLATRDDVDPRVLAALLNSTAIEFLMRSGAPVAKDGYLRYRRQFLVDLPIPELDRASSDRIEDLLNNGDAEELQAFVDGAYGIDPEYLRRRIGELESGRR